MVIYEEDETIQPALLCRRMRPAKLGHLLVICVGNRVEKCKFRSAISWNKNRAIRGEQYKLSVGSAVITAILWNSAARSLQCNRSSLGHWSKLRARYMLLVLLPLLLRETSTSLFGMDIWALELLTWPRVVFLNCQLHRRVYYGSSTEQTSKADTVTRHHFSYEPSCSFQ